MRIELDFIPPSVNHAYKKRGNGFGMYMTEEAKAAKKIIHYLGKTASKRSKWKLIPKNKFSKIRFIFEFKNNRHPDPNNLLKLPIDALEGVWYENDKNLDVETISSITGNNKTIIEISEDWEGLE